MKNPDKADRALIERLVAQKRIPQPDIVSIGYFTQGNFTIALVYGNKAGKRPPINLVGVAKRNCGADDIDDPRRGKDIALTRALQRLNPPPKPKTAIAT